MDIKTLLLALALGNLSLCAALFFFEAGARRSGILPADRAHLHATWSRAKQCQAVAWGLLYLRGVLPDFLTIPFANAVLFAGFALDASALWEQAGRRVWRPYLSCVFPSNPRRLYSVQRVREPSRSAGSAATTSSTRS